MAPAARRWWPRLVRLELTELLRSRAIPGALALVIASGVAGVWHGRTVIDRQRAALVASPALQKEEHRAILDPLPPTADAGDQLFYLFFHTAHEPSAWAPFSIGQRDVHAFNLKIRLLAIHGQLYDLDLGNPLLTAFGNFDAAFVIIFLVPLVVIALCYNVWSAEQENGTWDLLRSHAIAAWKILALKLGVRAALAMLAPIAIVTAAIASLSVALNRDLATLVVLTLAYTAVWIAVTAVVIGLNRSSEFNALALVGIWMVWAVLGPALINSIAALRFPTPDALELTVRQRQGYHVSWDRPLDETMDAFYKTYPEWKSFPVPKGVYSNAWYYAMQHRGDLEAAPAATEFFNTLERRQQWMRRAAMLFPPAMMQLSLNDIARTDLDSYLGYLASVSAYHEALKHTFFPVIFNRLTVSEVDWEAVPRHTYRHEIARAAVASRGIVALTITAVALATIAALRNSTPPRKKRVVGAPDRRGETGRKT